MTEVISTIRPFLEVAYFAAGVLLVIGLVLTFLQVRLIQRDIELRTERAAKEKAIEATCRYYSDYVPASGKLYEALKAAKVSDYKGTIGDFSARTLLRPRMLPTDNKELFESLITALNELDAIASYFVFGVADEKTGFGIIGRTFCNTVENAYDLISFTRSDPAAQYWSSIVALYRLWRPRLHSSELEAQMTDLKTKLSQVQKRARPDEADIGRGTD